LGGSTIHSFSGVGLGEKGVRDYIGMSKTQKTAIGRAKHKWLETEVLIIDEISMLNPDLWEKLNGIAKGIRGGDSYFGGMQVVVCGDFFQLPPVPDNVKTCQQCGRSLLGYFCSVGCYLIRRRTRPPEERPTNLRARAPEERIRCGRDSSEKLVYMCEMRSPLERRSQICFPDENVEGSAICHRRPQQGAPSTGSTMG